jgi:hypothetical protein
MTIKAVRARVTARTWSDDPYDQKLNAGSDIIFFEFKTPSKGAGETEVRLRIWSESFESLAKTMRVANEDAAIQAFGAALLNKSQNAAASD